MSKRLGLDLLHEIGDMKNRVSCAIVSTSTSVKKRRQMLTWVNVICQILSPISMTFTPVIVARAEVPPRPVYTSTQPYILRNDDSIASIAAKFNTTPAQLEKLNQFRHFAHGFMQVGPGDEIDVPNPAMEKRRQHDEESAAQRSRVDSSRRETWLQPPAPLMQAGMALASSHPSEATTSLARTLATSAANEEIQTWLKQYGTARVQLSVDKNFSLQESALDWLLPLSDTPNLTLFTQLGARNKDHRHTMNIGVGARTLFGNWLFGLNTFYDRDLTGHNSRIGMGAEAWTDYLQLSANSYFRLGSWHQSHDFADYDERAANGFDLRANGWLPALPQLGAKLVYEQYQGEHVALFGKDNLQRNPSALTAGINYTPFPLLTIGIDERLGKEGHNDTQFNIQLNYHPGAEWQSQIDPGAVAATRRIDEARYNLVERNNNIVLEYKKQDLIHLALSSHAIRAWPGSVHTLSAILQSKYGIEQISWQDGGLAAAGGQLIALDKTHFRLTLPPYKVARARNAAPTPTAEEIAANTYHLTAIAFDSQGNPSNSETLVVTVQPLQAVLRSAPIVTGDYALANGRDQIGVDFIVQDSQGNPLVDREVILHTNNGAQPTTLTVKTDSRGIAHIAVTNTNAGITRVTAEIDGQTQYQDITFVHPDISITISGLVKGYPLVGETLSAQVSCGTAGCPSALRYQWQIEDAINSGRYSDIPGANATTYTPIGSDQKRRIQVIVNPE